MGIDDDELHGSGGRKRPRHRRDEMEVGVGIHGEPGPARHTQAGFRNRRRKWSNAITEDLARGLRGEAILLSRLRATPLSGYLMYDAVRRCSNQRYIVTRSLVGNFVTSLDMAGCSVTVSILDERLKRLWDATRPYSGLRLGM